MRVSLRSGFLAVALYAVFSVCAHPAAFAASDIKLELPNQEAPPFVNVRALQAQVNQEQLPEPQGQPQPAQQKQAEVRNSDPLSPNVARAEPPVVQVPGNRPANATPPAERNGQLESWQVDNMSASSFANLLEGYKKIVNESEKQTVPPHQRTFVELSRNYVNVVHCDGKIENLVIPQDRGMEAQILNNNHDLFLRVGAVDTRQFPLDMSLICEGNVYLINAVVHPHVPSQEVVLALPKEARPLTVEEKDKWKDAISKSEAMPLETQVSKIMQRVYADEPLPYWKELDTPSAESRWSYTSYSVLLQKVIDTNISDLVAWDFVFRGKVPNVALYDTLRQVVRGEIVAYGRVAYDSQSAARIIVLTKK